jgi:hypothetical protein
MKARLLFGMLLISGLLLLAGVFLGCDDDECPVCPDPAVTATIDNIWPNADGNWWQYDYSWRVWDQDPITFTNEIDVPPAPSLDEIAGIFDSHPIGTNVTVLDRRYQLLFAGLDSTKSGVRAQNLEMSIFDPPPSRQPVQTVNGEEALYLRILAARPDLRDKITPLLNGTDQPAVAELLAGGLRSPSQPLDFGPNLIHDGIWWKTTDWIGTYGDAETRLAWKFLEANLTPGHEFSYQLIPSATGDAWMHCRVTRTVNVDTPAGSFKGALELIYLIDFGVLEYDLVLPAQYARIIEFGTVVYVPNYGPVYCYERNFVYVGTDTLDVGYGDRTLLLYDSNLIEE